MKNTILAAMLITAGLGAAESTATYETLIPVVVDGSNDQHEHTSRIQLRNMGATAVQVVVEFFQSDGTQVKLPFNDKNKKVAFFDRIATTVAPYAYVTFDVQSTEVLNVYAKVRSTSPSLNSEVLLGRRPLQNKEFSYMLIPATRAVRRASLQGELVDNLYLVNSAATSQEIRLTARDDGGRQVCQADLTMKPNERLHDTIQKLANCSDRQVRSLEVQATQGIAVFSYWASANGLNAIPVMVPESDPATLSTTDLESRAREILERVLGK